MERRLMICGNCAHAAEATKFSPLEVKVLRYFRFRIDGRTSSYMGTDHEEAFQSLKRVARRKTLCRKYEVPVSPTDRACALWKPRP